MPTLKKIVVQDFRNIAFQELSFSPNVNCISGNNGEGKTNLLDAIYYLSMTKSAFPAPDRYNWRFGTDGFTIGGTYLMDNGLESRFSIRVSEGEKKLVRDEKPCTRISEHIGVLPVVMVSPGDIALVSESGEERRRFVNGVLSQMDRSYLAAVQTYNRLLAQRNKMLKDGNVDWDLMDVFDARMAAAAQPAYEARKRFAEDLRPVIQSYYKLISGGSEEVSVEYRSDLAKAPLEELLKAGRDRDQVLRFTGSGIQRDDFLFTLDGHPIRRCGSQGQQKSFLVSLKFAQYEIMRDGYGYAPVLLLDDVFDKLDMHRIGNLIGMVAGSGFGQIFITDCNKVRLSGIVDQKRNYFVRRKEALTMEEVIAEYIKSAKIASGLNTQRIFAAWDACSGAGPFTLKRYFRSGTLYITLNSSVIRNQLSFQKAELVEKINATLSGDPLFTEDNRTAGFVKELVLK